MASHEKKVDEEAVISSETKNPSFKVHKIIFERNLCHVTSFELFDNMFMCPIDLFILN